MRIAIVTPEFVTEINFDGGLANYCYRLALSLKELGHEPVVFVSSEVSELIVLDGFEVHRVHIGRYDDWLFTNKYLCKAYSKIKPLLCKFLKLGEYEIIFNLKKQSKKLNNCIKEGNKLKKFDIIHYANIGGIGYYKPKDIPAIARISGAISLWYTFGGYGETANDVVRTEQLENRTLKKMDAIFGPCKPVSDYLEAKINKKIELIETIYIHNTKEGDSEIYDTYLFEKKYFLFFGTISQVKGTGTIAEIIYDLLEKHPEYYFVLVGKNSHSTNPSVTMLDVIKEQAKEYQDRVIHINKISHAKLFSILDHAQCVVLPSLIDNFPNTCIEAMAHGKIVIGTYNNGFDQLIEHQKSGYLIDANAPVQLLNAIEDIIALDSLKKQQIEANAKIRIEKLAPQHIVPQLINFYTEAIAKHHKK